MRGDTGALGHMPAAVAHSHAMLEPRLRLAFILPGNSIHTRRWLKYFLEQGHEVSLVSYGRFEERIDGIELLLELGAFSRVDRGLRRPASRSNSLTIRWNSALCSRSTTSMSPSSSKPTRADGGRPFRNHRWRGLEPGLPAGEIVSVFRARFDAATPA